MHPEVVNQAEEKVNRVYFSRIRILIYGCVGIATIGFKLDTLFATIRTAIESSGKLSTVLEEKVTPNISFQVREIILRGIFLIICFF